MIYIITCIRETEWGEKLQERVDSSERERKNRGSPNLDRDEERVQSGVSESVRGRTGGSAASSAESAAIHEFENRRSDVRFIIKIANEHVLVVTASVCTPVRCLGCRLENIGCGTGRKQAFRFPSRDCMVLERDLVCSETARVGACTF